MLALFAIVIPLRHMVHPLRPTILAFAALTTIVFGALPFLLKRTKNLQLCANLGLLSLFGLFFLGAMFANGVSAPVAVLGVLFPVIAMFFSGVRSGLLYTLLCIFGLVLLYALGVGGLLPTPKELSVVELHRTRAIILAGTILLSLAASWLYETSWQDLLALLQQFSSTSPDHLFLLDQEGTILFANPSAEAVFFRKPGDWSGLSFFAMIVGGKHVGQIQTLWQNIETFSLETQGEYYECLLQSEHHTLPVELVFGFSEELREPRIVVFARDISERFRIEKFKDELIANVSHELRTPLTSVYGSLRLMESEVLGKSPPDVLRLVKLASRNAERLNALVNDLLDIEKLTRGAMVFDFQIVDVCQLVALSVQSMELMAQDKSISLVLEIPEQPCYSKIDHRRTEQVLTNLMSNAIKFSAVGTTVKITLGRESEALFKVSIEDQGEGIPTEMQNEIFDRFVQVDAFSSTQQDGCGLGLAISKKIVEHIGGSIGVDSQVGVGSTFFFTLPSCQPDK